MLFMYKCFQSRIGPAGFIRSNMSVKISAVDEIGEKFLCSLAIVGSLDDELLLGSELHLGHLKPHKPLSFQFNESGCIDFLIRS